MIPMPLSRVAAAIGAEDPRKPGNAEKDGDPIVSSVSTDTRTIGPGSLFVALRGERFDGHDFLSEIAERGAVAAVVSRDCQAKVPLLRTQDTLTALGKIATAVRRKSGAWVVGVTGSVGKTSTKEMIALALGSSLAVLRSPANQNNEVGVPLTLIALERRHRAAVVEMGMRAAGEIDYLSRVAEPDAAVVTNIGTAHIGRLGSREAIAEAKAEVFHHLRPGGAAILNRDDDFYELLLSRADRAISYGLHECADVRAEEVDDRGLSGIRYRCRMASGCIDVELPGGGSHLVLNSLAAIATAMAAGVSVSAAAEALREFEPLSGRGAVRRRPSGQIVIDEAYNASPESMETTLHLLARTPGYRRRTAVLGDMLELGDYAEDGHREVGRMAARAQLSRLVCVGPQSKAVAEEAIRAGMDARTVHCYVDSEAAADDLEVWTAASDLILIKGSNGTRMRLIVDALLRQDEMDSAAGRGEAESSVAK